VKRGYGSIAQTELTTSEIGRLMRFQRYLGAIGRIVDYILYK